MRKPKPIAAPTIAVADAWAKAYDLAQGLSEIFYCAACSDEGLSKEAAIALQVTGDRLVEEMKIVNGFFCEME
ncbi:MAG TPA: hypothetical protein VE398_16050 [Acidobacteriota bacterium]|nr:hypothetical protein [Acidobacteriota bacterium]